MKKILSFILSAVMLFGCVSVLSSCGAPKDAGAEICIYLGDEIFDLDPSEYYVSTNAEQLLSLLYEPLFRINEKGKLKCAAADKYEIDEENREIIIEIRESYWSDDVQLKAGDFVYAWCERIINSSTQNPAAALFYDIEGALEVASGDGTPANIGIKASEMQEITITYREGADPERILRNLASVATAPVRQDIVESAPTYWASTASVSNTIITNGPFELSSYKKDTQELTLSRNKGYHQSPDKKDYDNKVNPGMLYTTFNTADNDVTVSYEDIENKVVFIMTDAPLSERADHKKKADVYDHTSTYTYVFNTQHPLFADYNVRRALSLILDRESIANEVTFGKAADGFLPDICGGSDISYISVNANESLAREYLAKADQSIIAQYKSFTVKIDTDEESMKIAQSVAEAWGKLGFTVNIEAVKPVETVIYQNVIEEKDDVKEVVTKELTTVYTSGIQYLVKDAAQGKVDYDVIAIDWQMYSLDAAVGLSSLTTAINGCGREFVGGDPNTSGQPDSSVARNNIALWSDSVYDQLVIDAWNTSDAEKRDRLLSMAEEYLVNAMPVCPIIFNQRFVFESSRISGIEVDAFGNFSFTDVSLRGYRKFFKNKEED